MPVRIYHRTKLGKNSGIVFSKTINPGRSSGKKGFGCMNILYWVTIGWAIFLFKWIFIGLYRFFKWSFKLIRKWINQLSINLDQKFSEKGHTFGQKKIKFVIICLLILLFSVCCMIYCLDYNSPKSISERATASSLTQTAIPTSTSTLTLVPTITATITLLPTETFPPTPQLTATKIVPTREIVSCDCSYNFDCIDFQTQQEAQACFNSCGGSSSYNFAKLDGSDGDGKVCESLP